MDARVKILAVIALVACVVTLFSACNSEGDDDDEDDFCVTYKDVEIKLGKSADSVLSKLGKKNEVYAGNCGGNGDVYQYTYTDIVLAVLTDSNKNSTIDKIEFISDSVKTSKGICVGASSEEVIKAHGEPTQKTNSSIEYKKGTLSLKFTISNGVVKNISYRNITQSN